MAARTCAEHGAEVLHISSPDHPDPAAMVNETCIGKRNAFCDLETDQGRAGFWKVLKEADVYVNSYLSLDKKGFSVTELTKARPGLVCLDYHGWDHEGEWSERGGFDQLACSATGFALEEAQPVEEGQFPKPSLPPTYLLNDYLAAVLGAAGVASALQKRSKEGGSYRVHLGKSNENIERDDASSSNLSRLPGVNSSFSLTRSLSLLSNPGITDLARICTWVQDLGSFQHDEIDGLPAVNHEVDLARIKTVEGPTGTTRYLPTCIRYKEIGLALAVGAEPLGASKLHWKQEQIAVS